MSVDLPIPIARYVAADNRGDTEAVAQLFAEHAVVRDEGHTFEGVDAIKRWKAEAKKKYQYTVEPLSSTQKDDQTIVPSGSPGISPEAPPTFSSSFDSRATRSSRWRFADGRHSSTTVTSIRYTKREEGTCSTIRF